MSAAQQRRYRFATQAQWSECLFEGVDQNALRAGGGVRPLAPFAQPPTRYATKGGAFAPVVSVGGETLWRDGAGSLYRLSAGDDSPEATAAPTAIAHAARVVATPGALWVASAATGQLERFDVDSLTRQLTIDLSRPVIDLAADGHGGVLVLVGDGAAWQVVGYDEAGRRLRTVTLMGLSEAGALVFLKQSARFVVLDVDSERPVDRRQARLLWFATQGGAPMVSTAIAGLRPCFSADALGSDGRERVFLAGREHGEGATGAHLFIFDEDGIGLADLPLAAPATGVAATRESLLVTDESGLSRFASTAVVPDGVASVQCVLVTPVLAAPDRPDKRRWLRADAVAALPAGSAIQIDVAATDDETVRGRLAAIADDASMSDTARALTMAADPDLTWGGATRYEGTDDAPTDPAPPYSAKLFELTERYIWVRVTLTASPGGSLPTLSRLDVLYPGLSLMQNLPAIYQREETDPTSVLRPLVGVLESSTQGLDSQISSMGSLIDPSTAQGPWLDLVARWLGLPWDDTLDATQKRNILGRAEELTRTRGTRAGLEALLSCLIPGSPPRFRITDLTADFGFAVVGGAACTGSRLPAMLGGRTIWSAELDSRAVLGRMRLPCPGQLDDGAWQLTGRVQVDVGATAAERQAWEPRLLALLTEMIPVNARLQLSWVSAQALRSHALDGTFRLEPAPTPHLGTDAVTGLARLPGGGTRLSSSGATLGTHLL